MKPAGIIDGASRSIDDAIVVGPNMAGTLRGSFRPLTIGIVRQTTIDFQTKEYVDELTTVGASFPLSAKQLEMKPEGERAWDWRQIICSAELLINTQDELVLPKLGRYRVLARWDYSLNGYMVYHAAKQATANGN